MKKLKILDNQITEITGLERLFNLHTLELEKNMIENLNSLLAYSLKNLRKIFFSFNKIPSEYLDDVIYFMNYFTSLEEVNFQGNEVALNKYYRIRMMQFPNLKILDKLALKPMIKKHAEV